MDFHEETGVLFNTGTVDQKQLMRHFGSEFVGTWNTAWWWVNWWRGNKPRAAVPGKPARGETETHAEWQRMIEKIVEERADLDPPDQEDVWILCVPPSGASDDAWKAHEELSEKLTRPLGALAAIEKDLDPLGDDAEKEPPLRVFCLAPWHRVDEHPRMYRLARALSLVLNAEGGFEALDDRASGSG